MGQCFLKAAPLGDHVQLQWWWQLIGFKSLDFVEAFSLEQCSHNRILIVSRMVDKELLRLLG
jgi:hypothetical protein